MFSRKFAALLLLPILLAITPDAHADIGVRAGAVYPQGDFRDFAKAGWRAEITADLNVFSAPFLSTVVSFSAVDFGKKESTWGPVEAILTQESKTALTGGGVGLRLEPPLTVIKPFIEGLVRIASIEQDYESGSGGSELKSRTKIGYQFNGGLKFGLAPKVSIEAGASWMTFPNCKFKDKEQEVEVSLDAFSIFGGLSLGIGL